MTVAEQKRLDLILDLYAQGVRAKQIAARLGLTIWHTYRLIRQARRQIHALPTPKADRPSWSIPGPLLLAEVHLGRKEIEAAEGYVRPAP